jgi:nucleotide-binding universal stress UspA family protein
MYKVIMLPTEGTQLEKPAITLAVRLAQKFDAELRLVRVETAPVVLDNLVGRNPLTITESDLRESRLQRLRKLEALGEQCRVLGQIRVITALEDGIVNPTLLAYATRFKVDLIVMSSHLRGGIERATLGSTSDYLIRNSEIPVLIAKPSLFENRDDPFKTVGKIVVALDGSSLAEQIIPHVAQLAPTLNASVNLLRVLTPQTYAQEQIMQPGLPWWDIDIAEADSYLAAVAQDLGKAGVSVVKDVVLSDNVPTAILDYCARNNGDLLAIASSGAGGFKRLVFGSVADEVTRTSPTSMLVFHALDREYRSQSQPELREPLATVQ